MERLDVYLSEIGRRLPQKSRDDILAEIRSALQDMLDERTAAGREMNEDLVLEVLKEYGSPEKVAASYLPERYLIGPRLYPAFIKTVRIALPIVLALTLVGLAVGVAQAPVEPGRIVEQFIETMADLVNSMVTVLGVIVLVYAILERTMPDLKEKPAEWDPRSLPKQVSTERVSIGEPITNVIFTLAALVIFNLYPQIIGITWRDGSGWVRMEVLSAAFWAYLPLINVLWISQVVLNLALVYSGTKTTWLRWLGLAVHGLEVGIALAMLRGPSLIGLTVEQLSSAGQVPADSAQVLVTLLVQAVRVTLVLVIGFGVWNIIRDILGLVELRRAPVLVQG